MYRDPDTGLPVLLMELMDESLTHFLETATRLIPYHIQVNICHDIALALTFLHANGIVHRDLSSNNVLLISNVRAKVTDFGMAKLGDLNPRMSRLTFTMCPGTDVYMPPEAVQDKPVYTEKIDCFSFGVIVVQMLTRQFPKPDDRMQRVEMNHPGLPRGTLMVCIPEADRRQNHISQIDPNNAFLPIALNCLNDSDIERPSAQQLCERVAALKSTDMYAESVRVAQATVIQLRDMQEQLYSLRNEHSQEIQQLQESQARELRSLREEHREIQNLQEIQSKEIIEAKEYEALELLSSKEREIQQLRRELTQAMHQQEPTEESLEGQLKQMQLNVPSEGQYTDVTDMKLIWRKGKPAPLKICRVCNAVVDKSMVYFNSGGGNGMQCYNRDSDLWTQLTWCPNTHSSFVIVNHILTAIGGLDADIHYSNVVYSLTKRGAWVEIFPPMPTKRCSTTAICTESSLVVAGGEFKGYRQCPVEVMSIEDHQWSIAVSIQEIFRSASGVICGDQLYILGSESKSVYSCTLGDLLQSCQAASTPTKRDSSHSNTWRKLADLPVYNSTCVSFCGHLIAIGGNENLSETTNVPPTKTVYAYNQTTNSWEMISEMSVARNECFAAALPATNELMVMGGTSCSGMLKINLNSVEFASLM
jgi:serine/threonine protein kinase